MLPRITKLPEAVQKILKEVTSRNAAQEQKIFTKVKYLGVKYHQQEMDAWCWAACAEMVMDATLQIGSPRQCEIVNQALGRDDCCSPGNELCNKAFGEFRGLLGHYQVNANAIGAPFQFIDLQQQLDRNKPLIYTLRFGTQTDGGHTGVIGGYAIGHDGREWVYFLDPDSVFFAEIGSSPHGWIPYTGLVAAYGFPNSAWLDTWYNLQGGPGD